MKRWTWLGAVLIAMLVWGGRCAAEEPASHALEAVDLSGMEEFAGELAPELDFRGVLDGALRGELPSMEELFQKIQGELWGALRDALKSCAGMIAPALLLAVMGCALPGRGGGIAGARFLILCLLFQGMMKLTLDGMAGIEACLRRAGDFADAVSPPLTALMTASGMTSGAALISPMAALAGNAVENLLQRYGIPLCRFALATAIAGNLSDAIDLSRAYRLMRKTSNWGAGLAVTLFTALTAIQGNLTAGLDGVAVRTAKYAVDSVTPVIGSGISDAWDSYVSGIMIAKNAIGVSGVTLLIAVGLRPMLRSGAAMISMNLFAALMDAMGEKRAARAAEQAAGVCQMLLALCTAALTIGMILLAAAMAAGRGLTG